MTEPYGCWPLDDKVCGAQSWDGYSAETQDWATMLAVNTLRRLTLHRVGGCPVTVRPCRTRRIRPRGRTFYSQWMVPVQTADGGFTNVLDDCGGCAPHCSVELPGYVGRVDAVTLDGVEQDLADFHVEDNSHLVYNGTGDCPFPSDALEVTYLPAHEVDTDGQVAAALLAVEFAKSCAGKDCQLPPNITQLVRQGVVQSFDLGAFPRGITNIKGVDAFVMTWNPRLLKSAPRVWSPDLPQARTTTWSGA